MRSEYAHYRGDSLAILPLGCGQPAGLPPGCLVGVRRQLRACQSFSPWVSSARSRRLIPRRSRGPGRRTSRCQPQRLRALPRRCRPRCRARPAQRLKGAPPSPPCRLRDSAGRGGRPSCRAARRWSRATHAPTRRVRAAQVLCHVFVRAFWRAAVPSFCGRRAGAIHPLRPRRCKRQHGPARLRADHRRRSGSQ